MMNQDTQALLDTGSVVTLLRPDLAGGKEGDPMEVACVHGDTRVYATCHVVVRPPHRDRPSPTVPPAHRKGLPDLPPPVEPRTGVPTPEALPLRAATAKAVARELMLLFSRVGIAREVLTDQGSCFMSRVMKELLSLLQVKQLRSVYHPQMDGLVERFNKTLKQMLKKAMVVDGKNWDQLLPHVIFAILEVPQASTGFSPFELLYG